MGQRGSAQARRPQYPREVAVAVALGRWNEDRFFLFARLSEYERLTKKYVSTYSTPFFSIMTCAQ